MVLLSNAPFCAFLLFALYLKISDLFSIFVFMGNFRVG